MSILYVFFCVPDCSIKMAENQQKIESKCARNGKNLWESPRNSKISLLPFFSEFINFWPSFNCNAITYIDRSNIIELMA